MSVLRLYAGVSDIEPQRFGADSRLKYAVKDGVLRVYLKRRRGCVYSVRLKLGEMYDINYSEDRVNGVCRVVWPRKRKDVLMWLLGFANGTRYAGRSSYYWTLHKWWRKHSGNSCEIQGWRECCLNGDDYGFTKYKSKLDGTMLSVAAYIGEKREVDKAFVKEIFCKWRYGFGFPQPYVRRILQEVFDFTQGDLAELDAVRWE